MQYKYYSIVIIGICFLSTHAGAQTTQELNEHIAYYNNRIQAFFDSSRYHNYFFDSSRSKWTSQPPVRGYDDSLLFENKRLKQYLISTLPNVSGSLTSYVPAYQENISFYGFGAVTSQDKKFRQWAWDTWMGGTMPTIWQVFEYEISSGVIKVFDPIDTGIEVVLSNSSYMNIYSVIAKNGNKIYLPVEGWKGDSRTWGENIAAFMIRDNTLIFGLKIFEGSVGMESILSYACETNVSPKNPDPFKIEVRKNGTILLIPYFTNGNKWKHKLYKFDGEHFIYKGVTK